MKTADINGAQDAKPATGASRRAVLAGASGLAAAFGLGQPALAEGAGAAEASADFLFVQTAQGMRYDAEARRLTLTDASPVTLFFSDRPERIAGNMKTADFVPFWSEGSDSFLSDPPNADISIFEAGGLRQVVAVLRDPALEGDALSYAVEIIDGEMPASGENVSVFIDIIGMPLTPVSVAGVRRREFRRAAIYR